MSSSLPVVLAVVYEAYNVDLLLGVGIELNRRGLAQPVLLSPYWLPDTPLYVERAAAHGIPYLWENDERGGDTDMEAQLAAALALLDAVAPPGRAAPRPAPRGRTRLRSWAAARWLRRVADLPPEDPRAADAAQWLAFYRARQQRISRVLDTLPIDLLLLAEHNIERDSAVWSREAKRRGAPTAVVSTSSPDVTEAARVYAEAGTHLAGSPGNRLLPLMRRSWRLRHEGRAFVRHPAARAFVLEHLGLAPPLPWVLNSSPDISCVCVESELLRRQWIEAGLAPERLHATGTPALDALHRRTTQAPDLRAEVLHRLGLPERGRLAVVALPPDQYPGRSAPEFGGHDELVRAWLAPFEGAEGWNVVVSPHPAIDVDRLPEPLPGGARLLRVPASELVPLADLFVASVSTTIRLALMCGRPVLDYDVYQYGYDQYRDCAAVVSVDDLPGYEAALGELLGGERLAELSSRGRREAEQWGRLDGQAGDRLTTVIGGLLPAPADAVGSSA